MSDGNVQFDIVADNSQVSSAIDDTTQKLKKAASEWEGDTRSAANSTSLFGSILYGVGEALGEAILSGARNAGRAILDFAADCVAAASQIEEIKNVVDSVFGDQSGGVYNWADSASSQYGLSQRQALQYTSTMGSFFSSAGIAKEEIQGMSMAVAGLVGDMASFYNMDHDTAFQKIRSGLSGETEPLKSLGINMNVANMEAFALEQGITKTWKSMSQAEQTMLRYNYLMQQTAIAQGDFARTSDSYANSQRRIENAWENIKSKVGESLLPSAEAASNAMAKFLEGIATPTQDFSDQMNAVTKSFDSQVEGINAAKSSAQGYINTMQQLQNENPDGLTGDALDIWNVNAAKLAALLPEVNGMIDRQTGSIKGGTEALNEYLDTWTNKQTQDAIQQSQLVRQGLLESESQRINQLKADLYDSDQQLKAMSDIYSAYEKIFSQAGVQFLDNGQWVQTGGHSFAEITDDVAEAISAYEQGFAAYQQMRSENNALHAEYDKAVSQFESGAKEWEEINNQLNGTAEAASEAAAAAEELAEAGANIGDGFSVGVEEAKSFLEDLKKQLSDIAKYQNEVIASAYQQINKDVHGFEGMDLEEGFYETGESIKEMSGNLDEQIQYLNEYSALLDQLKDKGISSELLASVADGSKESYTTLKGLADATSDQLDAINRKWDQVNQKKTDLAKSIATERLAVDAQYQAMIQAAEEMAAAMDQSGTAGAGAAATIAAVVSAVAAGRAELESEVAAIAALMAQIGSMGGFSGGGGTGIIGSTGAGAGVGHAASYAAGHAMGLDFVPYDGYLAQLHHGEAILTADEAALWRSFTGANSPGDQTAFDYDMLTASISSGMPSTAGNVYLDGQTVGRVISESMGDSYRRLERSGWRG